MYFLPFVHTVCSAIKAASPSVVGCSKISSRVDWRYYFSESFTGMSSGLILGWYAWSLLTKKFFIVSYSWKGEILVFFLSITGFLKILTCFNNNNMEISKLNNVFFRFLKILFLWMLTVALFSSVSKSCLIRCQRTCSIEAQANTSIFHGIM